MQQMTWKGELLRVQPPATDERQEELLQALKRVDDTFDYRVDANSKRIAQHPVLMNFLDHHTRSGQYVWQYSRNPMQLPALPLADEPVAAGADAPASPQREPDISVSLSTVLAGDTDAPLPWLPAPVPAAKLSGTAPQQGDKLFAPLSAVLGYEPDYGHAPSCEASAVAAANAQARKANTLPCVPKRVRMTMQCGDPACAKPRAVFGQRAVVTLRQAHGAAYVNAQIEALLDDNPQQFQCGGAVFPPDHPLASELYTDPALQCSSPLEPALYAALDEKQKWEAGGFNAALCCECGREELSAEACAEMGCPPDEHHSMWKHYPLCDTCKSAGAQLTAVQATRKTPLQAQKQVRANKRGQAGKKRASEEALALSSESDEEDSLSEGTGSDDDEFVVSGSKRARR